MATLPQFSEEENSTMVGMDEQFESLIQERREKVPDGDEEAAAREKQNIGGLVAEPAAPKGLYSQYSPSQLDTLFNTISSPASSGTRKTNALAALSSTPEWQAAIKKIAEDVIPNRDAAIEKVIATQNAVAAAEGEVVQLAKTKGQLLAERFREDAAQKQRIAADTAGYVARKGLDTEDYNSIVNQQAVENVNLYYKMRETQDAIAEKTAVNFLDDPATWLLNQFTVGDDVAEFNKAANRYNLNNKFIDESAAQIVAVRNANAGKIAANSAREVELMATQALIEAEETAVKARIQTLKSQGASEKEIQAIQDAATQRILTIEQRDTINDNKERDRKLREQEAEDRKRRNAEIDDRLKNSALDRRIKEQLLAEKAEIALREKKAQEDSDARVAKAMAAAGRPDITTEKEWNAQSADFKAATSAMKSSGGDLLAEDIPGVVRNAKYIQAALRSDDPKVKAEAKATYPPQQIQLISSILAFEKEARALASKDLTLKGKALDEQVNKLVLARYEKMKENPEGYTESINGSPTNYYNSIPLKTLAAMPSLVKNKVAESIGDFAKANPGIKEVKSNQVLELLVSRMEKKPGDKEPRENISTIAGDVNKFYQAAVDSNNLDMKYSKYSLPAQDRYPLKYRDKMYDLTSPEQTHMLLLQMYKDRLIPERNPNLRLREALEKEEQQRMR